MEVRALFRGPCHVLEAVEDYDEEVAAAMIGRPIAEMFPDSGRAIAAMDEVYLTGRTVAIPAADFHGRAGIAVIGPVDVQGRRWGVVAEWTPRLPSRPTAD